MGRRRSTSLSKPTASFFIASFCLLAVLASCGGKSVESEGERAGGSGDSADESGGSNSGGSAASGGLAAGGVAGFAGTWCSPALEEAPPPNADYPGCGNGHIQSNETCDDGNYAPGDGCDERCMVDGEWQCDGAPSACHLARCGDGVVEGPESCDDGNAASADGCAPNCRLESICGTDGCEVICGDQVVEGGLEACDDGNLRSADGCSPECLLEPGWQCPLDEKGRSVCVTNCGDGILSPGETCDTGSDTSNYGLYRCTANCEWAPYCGDGTTDALYGEQCDKGHCNGLSLCDAACVIVLK